MVAIMERQCLASEVLGTSCFTSGGFLSMLQEYLSVYCRGGPAAAEGFAFIHNRQAKAVFYVVFSTAEARLALGILQMMLCCRGENAALEPVLGNGPLR